MGSQLSRRLVYREPGRISSDLEEDSAGLPEIHGVEVLPVNDGSDVPALSLDLRPLSQLDLIVIRPEGDMMHCADTARPAPESGDPPQIHHRTDSQGAGLKPEDVAVLPNWLKAHRPSQKISRTGVAVLPNNGSMKAANRVLSRCRTFRPGWSVGGPR